MSRPVILLVDDKELFLELEKGFLRGYAITVYTASSGREALAILGMIRPDLVYIAMDMPGMDGPACCAEIKADPDLRGVPVVLVGVQDEEREVSRCIDSGCDAIIKKPVTGDMFVECGCCHLPRLATVDFRVPCNVQVVFTVCGVPAYGRSVDLSKNGMYIASQQDVHPDDEINVTFMLPAPGDVLIETAGRVAWVNGRHAVKNSLPPGFGIEFTDLPAGISAHIARYLEGRTSTDGYRIEPAYFVTA